MRRYEVVALLVSLVALAPDRVAAQAGNEKLRAPSMSAAEKQVVQNERAIWDALKSQDWTTFGKLVEGVTTVDMNGVNPGIQRAGLAEQLKTLVTNSYELSEIRARTVTPTVILLTYKIAVDQTFDGKHVPSPLWGMSLWHKKGAKWVPVAHSEANAADAK
jgi:uncharacterized protein DUF4440